MFNSAVLDVAIALIFIYIVLSLICSGLSGGLASLLSVRANVLRLYITQLLGGSATITAEGSQLANAFFDHPLIRAIVPPARYRRGRMRPQYPDRIPPGLSAIALMSAISLMPSATHDITGRPSTLEDRIQHTPAEPLRIALWSLWDQARGEADHFYALLADLFEYSDRLVESAYRRQVSRYLLVIAAVITIALNIDTVHIAQVLWSDALRNTRIATVHFPVGWSADARTVRWNGGEILSKLAGWALTIGAVTFGAEFWLSLLERVARVPRPQTERQDREQGNRPR